MNNDGANPPEPVTSVLAAAENFAGQLRAEDRVSVVTFATDAIINSPLTTNRSTTRDLIKRLTIKPEEERGSTNTGDALKKAREELTSARHNPDARSVIVLLTDGLATAPGDDPEAYALEEATKVIAEDITVFTIGLGASVNMDFLRSIASTPEQAFAAPATSTLKSIYSAITAAICEDGAARIDVIPKTRSNFAPLENSI
jgi:Mg-chelatase subunit ChlD